MKSSLLIISPFPPRGKLYSNKFSALSSFVANKIKSLHKKFPNIPITILADKLIGESTYQDKNIGVIRAWERNSFFAYWNILKEVIKKPTAKKILIELEWSLFGRSPYIISFMSFFIALLRLLGKEIYVVLHEVSLDFDELAPQLGIKRQSVKSKIYDLALKIYYFGIVLFSTKIIVLEQAFENRLHSYYHTSKVTFIPHGVDTDVKIIEEDRAKKQLGIDPTEFVILNFGFINWYKGTDILVDLFTQFMEGKNDKKYRLIIAGGESEIHKADPNYRNLTKTIRSLTKDSSNIQISGFIPDEKIYLYFNSADVVILPHRVFISSSGPLSLAFSYERPILLSERLENYLLSGDIQNAVSATGLDSKDILFSLNDEGFSKSLEEINSKSENLSTFSKYMKRSRDWDTIAKQYIRVLEL